MTSVDKSSEIKELFDRCVIPSYGRYDLVFEQGKGSSLWDTAGNRYFDFGAGIAVNSLGHASRDIAQALYEQSQRLVHISNLYYHEQQGVLARRLSELIGPGKCFFANSGAEANEGLYKLARRFGQETGRFEIITAVNSFHGRTLAGIAATGQEKVKVGFGPAVPGFKHVPFNDLDAVASAVTAETAAVLIEGIQGEGGLTPAAPEFLLGLRRLCDDKKLLLLLDSVQCGFFRTGCFQSYQRILEGHKQAVDFIPDAVSMAKSLGGGFPIGAFWARSPHCDLLGPGSHGSTFGGTPLACAVANCILDVVERDQLALNAREAGEFLREQLQTLVNNYPQILTAVRGLGLMLGLEVVETHPLLQKAGKTPASHFAELLQRHFVLTIPAGKNIVRLLPPLNITKEEASEGIGMIEQALKSASLGE